MAVFVWWLLALVLGLDSGVGVFDSFWTMICAVQSRLSLSCEGWGVPLDLWSLAVLLALAITPLFSAVVVWSFDKFVKLLMELVQQGLGHGCGWCRGCCCGGD